MGARRKSFKRQHNFPSTARTGRYDGVRGDSGSPEHREVTIAYPKIIGVSKFLCMRHNMNRRSMYAEQAAK